MRVVMTQRISGTRNGVLWPDVGGEIVVSDDEAAQLITSRLATAAAAKVVPAADRTDQPSETAEAPQAPEKRRR